MRSRKHRGYRDRPIDRPMSIEKIESRFDKLLEEKQLLAEAFLLGTNKYGNQRGNGRVADSTPIQAIRWEKAVIF